MVRRLFEKRLLCPEDLQPSRDDWEIIGVFNPGAVAVGDDIVLLVRVAEQPCERRAGYTGLPRWDPELGPIVEWVKDETVQVIDPRMVRRRKDGLLRLTFLSYLRVIRSHDGRTVDDVEGPRFEPLTVCEEFGVEDPRITRIGDTFYFTYVAVSRHGAATALASTNDFATFRRHGIVFPPDNKDVVLFPAQIGDTYAALHRPISAAPFTLPEMWIGRSPDLLHWGQHAPLAGAASAWETDRIGAGPPPLRTPHGWLEIYHGSQRSPIPGKVGAYSAGALLLDLEDPTKIVRRTTEALLVPETDYDRHGFVPDVLFATGIVQRDERVLLFYGAADTSTAVVELSCEEVLASLHAS
jgi:beta-1,2-mannobiose phosphorylase / 1,2-beta-oligomannan phosphorylase